MRLQQKTDEAENLSLQALSWRDQAERLDSECNQLRDVIQDLEDKNRKLVEKINQQILQSVTDFKEKALRALTRGNDSPTKQLRRVLQSGGDPGPHNGYGYGCSTSEQRLQQVVSDENRAPN